MQELAMIEKGSELQVLTDGLPKFIEQIKSMVDTDESDIDTKKGRAEIVSNAFKITKAKTSIASKIDDLIESKEKEIEPTLKIISTLKASKKTTNAELTELSKSTRKAVTDWESKELVRIADDKLRLEKVALAIEIESDYSSALVEDELFEMKLTKKLDEERAERQALELKEKEDKLIRDKKIADDAVAKVKAAAEAEKAQLVQDKLDAVELAKQAIIDKDSAKKLAEKQKSEDVKKFKAAKIQASKEKKEAIEQAKQDEIKRQSDEKAAEELKRINIEKNKKHVGSVLKEIKEQIMKDSGIDEATAKKVVNSIREIERITITY